MICLALFGTSDRSSPLTEKMFYDEAYELTMAKEGRKRTVRNHKVDRSKKDTTKKYESRDDNVVKKD